MFKSPSILRNLFLSFLAFGLAMGIIFPFYAQFFVEWKPGMYWLFSVGCLVAGSMIGIINYYLLKVVLLKKLKRIADISSAISQKDISHECHIESDDVIGEIVTSFNKMTQTLREILSEINEDVEMIGTATGHARAIANRTTAGADSQQQKIDQVATAMNQMSVTVQEVAKSAADAADATFAANEQAETAKVVVVDAMGAVDTLADMVREAASAINELEAESGKISSVVSAIHGISEQTNLLALNAAIEAARAGEQGRGFAVVADEVRTLATRTQQSTMEISEMINSLQAGAQNAVTSMEKGEAQAVEGVAFTQKATEALTEIAGAISTIRDMNTHIALATREQGTVTEEVNQNIVGINDLALQASDGAKETASAIHDLENQATKLSGLTSGFKY